MQLDKEHKMEKHNIKEWFRKRLVSLKKKPSIIPLLFIAICCIIFNFNLTPITNSTVLIYASGMGFCVFVISLCSYLTLVSYVQAFPKRKPAKKMNIILTIVMLVISICADAYFYYCILYGTQLRTDPAPIPVNADIEASMNTIIIHFVFLVITLLLIAFLPLYCKLFAKIDTSVKIEEVKIDTIEIASEE